ncbi:MAG: hypothetical protein CMI12_17100, partial [Oceanospirillum sp.]|nr:hypothetical protein [Oceanospirillum sp.]
EQALTTAKGKAEAAANKLADLQQQANAAKAKPVNEAADQTAASDQPEEDTAAKEKALKQAKIILAATRTALKKAEKALAEAEQSGDADAISEQQQTLARCQKKFADAEQKMAELTGDEQGNNTVSKGNEADTASV